MNMVLSQQRNRGIRNEYGFKSTKEQGMGILATIHILFPVPFFVHFYMQKSHYFISYPFRLLFVCFKSTEE